MFLIRTAFWLAVVIALIPVDETVEAKGHAVLFELSDTGEAIAAAQATISDLGAFCVRNPSVCEVGGELGTLFALKAKTGARMVYEYLDGMTGGADEGADAAGTAAAMTLPAERTHAENG